MEIVGVVRDPCGWLGWARYDHYALFLQAKLTTISWRYQHRYDCIQCHRTCDPISSRSSRIPWCIVPPWRFTCCIRRWRPCSILRSIVLIVPSSQLFLHYVCDNIILNHRVTTSLTHSLTATVPIAMFTDRHSSYRLPLIIGLFTLLCCEIMFMEAPKYWVMVLARIMQGMSSSTVWTSGLALLWVMFCPFVMCTVISNVISTVPTRFLNINLAVCIYHLLRLYHVYILTFFQNKSA